MEDYEIMGATLGTGYIQTKLVPEMGEENHQVKLFDEEETWMHPPFYFVYGLNGIMKTYYFYHYGFQRTSLINEPKKIRIPSINNQIY